MIIWNGKLYRTSCVVFVLPFLLKACSTRTRKKKFRLWLKKKPAFFPNGTARRTISKTIHIFMHHLWLSSFNSETSGDAGDECWSHTHWSEESHNSNCPWCFLEAPTASWSRLVDGDVSDRFFDRLSGGSTVSNFFGARFKAWWKIHSSPLVAVCFPSSENAGVFGGEQWVAVLAAALLVHQLVPQQKNRKNITLYNIKSNWKDLASTWVQKLCEDYTLTWIFVNSCHLCSKILEFLSSYWKVGQCTRPRPPLFFGFIDLPKDRKDRKDSKIVELTTVVDCEIVCSCTNQLKYVGHITPSWTLSYIHEYTILLDINTNIGYKKPL